VGGNRGRRCSALNSEFASVKENPMPIPRRENFLGDLRKRLTANISFYQKFVQLGLPPFPDLRRQIRIFTENDKCDSKTWRHMVIFPTEPSRGSEIAAEKNRCVGANRFTEGDRDDFTTTDLPRHLKLDACSSESQG